MVDMTGAVLSPDRRRMWMKRFGTIGFCFFLAKGLVWLAVPLLVWLGMVE